MKALFSAVVLALFVIADGQMFAYASEKSLNRHYHKHIVQAKPSSNASSILKYIRIKHEESADEELYLHIKGSVTEPWDRNRTRARITASFIDEQGNVIAEKNSEVLIRPSSSRNKQESFSIKVKDDPAIVQCNLNVEWIDKSEDDVS